MVKIQIEVNLMNVIAYILAANEEEANRITDHLLEERLAACVNTFGVRSRYWWKGKIETTTEVAMIVKTREELVSLLVSEVRRIHSYEAPVIDIIKAESGYDKLEEWLKLETGKIR